MNTITPGTPIMLDKERVLRVDFNALAELETRQGRTLFAGESWSNMKIADVRFMLVTALKHDETAPTAKALQKFITLANLPYLVERIARAWSMAVSGEDMPGVRPLEIPLGA
jgi:uncharacterized protein (DUF1800 family)